MNTENLKSHLNATKPWPFYLLKQSSAFKELAASSDPAAVAVLVEAVDGKHRLAGKITSVLNSTKTRARIDALCDIWVAKRQDWLGRMIMANRWAASSPGAHTICALKTGQVESLPTDPPSVAAVLQTLGDPDADVRAGVASYASRLPDEARANDALYDAWIRTQSREIREVLTSQQRLPSSVAKETLLRLSMGDAESYLALEDENGQIFREAWGLASDELRQTVVQTVTRSGNARLIDAYTKALGVGSGGGADTTITLEARKTAGDEDGLFDACRPLKLLDLLDQCSRWDETGRRPGDPAKAGAVDTAIAAWKEVGKIEFEEAPKLPDGLVDFFDAELESSLSHPDPLMRLHAAVNGKGTIDPQQWIKSVAWPERLAARLLDPSLAGTPDHVQWTSLAGGVISNTLLTTTAEGTPAEHENLLRLRDANAGRNDRASVINRGLAGVLIAFQSYFQRGTIVAGEDDSAQDQAAIQVGGEAAAEDLEF